MSNAAIATAEIRQPTDYQLSQLQAAGRKRMPKSFDEAKALVDKLPTTALQAALLAEIGQPVPRTCGEASQALDAYAAAHPEWAAARKAAQQAKARATRAANRQAKVASGEAPEHDAQLLAYREAAVQRWGRDPMQLPATIQTIAKLRQEARRLPVGDGLRISAYVAMKAGVSQDAANQRIHGLLAAVALPTAA